MKMTLEITDAKEAIAILAALSGHPAASTTDAAAAAPAPQETVQQIAAPTPAPASAPIATPAPASPIPTSTPTYTFDQLAVAGAGLMSEGKQEALLALLKQFGVPSIQHLKPDQLGAFAAALRGLGAKL